MVFLRGIKNDTIYSYNICYNYSCNNRHKYKGESMNIKEYCEAAGRTKAQLSSLLEDNLHMVLGMVTEAGELADVYKKNLAYTKPIDLVNAKEEIGDIMWYIANYCNVNGFDLEAIMERNIEKLRARYPEKFTTDKAINRDLEAEREVLSRR